MIGKLLIERYTILEKIGIGGMSEVYKAEDIVLKRFVAIKILKSQFAEDEEFVKNFSVEAQSAASLNHPNVINIYDVGIDEIDDKKVHFIVMEYIDGDTLKTVIQERSPLTCEEIQHYGVQIAKALKIAHDNNIIHRDIKPQNIMITKDNQVKVTDFGIARVASSSTITYTSTILGTVHYISPEQAKGKFIDRKSDIYALGVVLYEMATGKVPFDGENSVAIAIKHIQEQFIPARLLNENVAEGLDYIISKCLEKNPAHRYQDVGEIIEDLLNYTNVSLNTSFDETAKLDIKIASEYLSPEKEAPKQNVYRTKSSPSNTQSRRKGQKQKRDIFRTVIFPFLLSILILIGIWYGYKYVKNSLKTKDILAPNIVDYGEEKAKEILLSLNLKGELGGMIEDGGEEGKVVRQDPLPDTKIRPGSTIVYYLSSGEKLIEVRDYTNMNINEWQSRVSIDNLEQGKISYEFNDEVDKDKIISQTPLPFEKAKKGTKVDVLVSKGKKEDKVAIPKLIGKTFEEAKVELEGLKLKVKMPYIEDYSENYDKGIVIDQSLPPDKEVYVNTEILLSVSLGKKEASRNERDRINIRINLTPDKNRYNYPITVVEKDGDRETVVYNQTYHEGDKDYVIIKGYSNCLYLVYHDDILINQYVPDISNFGD